MLQVQTGSIILGFVEVLTGHPTVVLKHLGSQCTFLQCSYVVTYVALGMGISSNKIQEKTSRMNHIQFYCLKDTSEGHSPNLTGNW